MADSSNTILWIGGLPPQFSVFLSHPDPDVLVSLRGGGESRKDREYELTLAFSWVDYLWLLFVCYLFYSRSYKRGHTDVQNL